jgi:hypothetical protein
MCWREFIWVRFYSDVINDMVGMETFCTLHSENILSIIMRRIENLLNDQIAHYSY